MAEALHDALLLARAGRAAGGRREMAEHFDMITLVLNEALPQQKPQPKKKRSKKKATQRRERR